MSQQRPEEDEQSFDAASQVYHYRKAGETFAAIARRMNLSYGRVSFLYNKYMDGLSKYVSTEEHKVALTQELERLDDLQAAFWDSALQADKDSARVVLDVMKHRAQLQGLNNPNPTDINVVHTVLVTGHDRAEFLRSLEEGRRTELPSGHRDNDIVGEVDVEEALG